MSSERDEQRWTALEDDLRLLPGVLRVRVLGEDAPTEIHVVGRTGRPASDIETAVRTVVASFGFDVSAETISVVQLDQSGPRAAGRGRLVLDSIVVGTRGDSGWTRLGLKSPDGERFEGSAPLYPSRDARARAVVAALMQALEVPLERLSAQVEVKDLFVYSGYPESVVVVQVVWHQNGQSVALAGSAIATDDPASAGARAILHALNRKLLVE
jgi:hypothetical protein